MPWFSVNDGLRQMLSHATVLDAEQGIAFRSSLQH